MSPQELVLDYIWPERGTFWRWSTDGDAVTWFDGGTLALYPEIENILSRLELRGYPKFEELLLVVAACRASWEDSGGGAERLERYLRGRNPGSWGDFRAQDWGERLKSQLRRVHQLAAQNGFHKQTSATILEAAFLNAGDHLGKDSAFEIAAMFRSKEAAVLIRQRFQVAQLPPPENDATVGLVETIRNVTMTLDALQNIDVEFLQETGLPGMLNPAELEELPFVERLRALVESLQEDGDAELSGIARIAQTLSAVVQLPKPLSEPDEMPLGGYSDIANRGNLDRLLVSELAQDPEVLAVRVALNEALYLRRESPPKQPARRRAIFVDVGIRLWGLPRVFAHSLALAFAMQSEPDAEVDLVTWDGAELLDAEPDSREGLRDLLSRLCPGPEPGTAVAQFLERFQAAGEDVDCVVITHSAVVADRQFRDVMRQNSESEFFLATVDGLGNFVLRAHNAGGSRELQHARLDLEKLLSGGSEISGADLLRNRSASLPLILRQTDFPLLLAMPIKPQNTVFDPKAGLVGYTKSGILAHWTNSNSGARMLSDVLPSGVVSWSEIDAERQLAWLLIPRADRSAELVTANLESGETSQTRINHGLERIYHTFRLEETLVLAGDEALSGHQLQDGRKVISQRVGRCVRGCGRFLKIGATWFAVGVRVEQFELTAVPDLPGFTSELVWESSDWSAPLAMSFDLSVFCLLDPPEPVCPPVPASFVSRVRMSSDGTRLSIRAKPKGLNNVERQYLVDIRRGEVKEVAGEIDARLEPGATEILRRSQNVRNRYSSVGVTPGGSLLVKSRGEDHQLTIPGGIPRLQWVKPNIYASSNSRECWEDFELAPPPSGARFRLFKAAWPDGSAAYLDQRGLLHLKSSDSTIPEVSLVMKDGMVSAWASTGEYLGNSYFIGQHPSQPPELLLGYVTRFASTAAASCGN